MRIDGFDEETSARMMTLSLVAVPVIAYILGAMAGVLIDNFIKKNYLDRLVAGIIAFALIYLFSKDLTHAIFAFVFVNIAYYVIHSYKKGIISKAQWKKEAGLHLELQQA